MARPDDIFLVTYPRSGTTWLQMILHQLTSDGEMEFMHISERFPWFERYAFLGRDIETFPSPRLFKSHLPYQVIPKTAKKYIYVMRDGRDVAESYYHMYLTHLDFKADFNTFFKMFMAGRVQFGSWFEHVANWKANRVGLNVLYLEYELLLADPEAGIRKIAEFCDIPLTPEKLARVVERSSFTFMKQYEMKFDQALEVLLEQGLTLGSFIRKGRAGEGSKRLTPEQDAQFQQAYKRWLPPVPVTADNPGQVHDKDGIRNE
jgi:hypothetical protein